MASNKRRNGRNGGSTVAERSSKPRSSRGTDAVDIEPPDSAGRGPQFGAELVRQGADPDAAQAEVAAAVDRFLYYAGWCDKYQQIFSSVNPVSSSHFNFSVLEPTGVAAVLAPQRSGLLGLVSVIAPVIAGGNTCIALASYDKPLCAVTLAEVLHASDLPGGGVHVLNGQ